MKKTKTLFASLALFGAIGFAAATASALNAPAAPAAEGEKVGTITDVITAAEIGTPSVDWSYTNHENVTNVSDAAYTIQCGLPSEGYFLLRAVNMNSGIITSTEGGDVTKIKVTFGDASQTLGVIDAAQNLVVFASDKPYESCTDLYYPTTWGEQIGTLTPANNEIEVSGDYKYLGLRPAEGTVALDAVEVTLSGPQYYVEPPVFDPEGEVIMVGTDVTLSCPTEGATIWYQIGEDGDVIEYTDGDIITPMKECTIYAWATTHDGNCKSEIVSQSYEYARVDNLAALTDIPQGIPFVYDGELVVISNYYSYDPSGFYVVWDGTSTYLLNFPYEVEPVERAFVKGDYIAEGWLAENTPFGLQFYSDTENYPDDIEDYIPTWAGKIENIPAAPEFESVAGCQFAWIYCTLMNVELEDGTPEYWDFSIGTIEDEEVALLNILPATVDTEDTEWSPLPAGTYNVTGMWWDMGAAMGYDEPQYVFIPMGYAPVKEQFDLTNVIGNYNFWGYSAIAAAPLEVLDSDDVENSSYEVTIRQGEGLNEVLIKGLDPNNDFTVTGIVDLDNHTITIPAQDVEIDGVTYRFCNMFYSTTEEEGMNCYEPVIATIYASDELSVVLDYFTLANYDNRMWNINAMEAEYLSRIIPGDLYLFGEMNAWGNDEEINDDWKFQSYDGHNYTLVIPADIPADRMFIITTGVYVQTEEPIKSWGGVTGMSLNEPYTLFLQNPYYVSHCNLNTTLPAGSTVKFNILDYVVEFDTTTAIESIESAAANNAIYYNLNGIQVESPMSGNLYIRVLNGKASKVIIK